MSNQSKPQAPEPKNYFRNLLRLPGNRPKKWFEAWNKLTSAWQELSGFGQEKSSIEEPAMSMDDLQKMVRAEDMEYISDKNAAILMRTPSGGRFLIYVVGLALVSLITWASIVKLDEITRGMG
ncbi:MAG: hypothetical protein ACPGEF_05865, partial [Endozoicomonas sp.]